MNDLVNIPNDKPGSNDRVNEKTYVIIGISTLLLILLILIVQFVVIDVLDSVFVNEEFVFHRAAFWSLGVVLIFFILWVFTFSGFRNKKLKPGHLYVLFFLVATIIFTFINYTGGLTNSPFTSMYAGLMTLTFLIYEKSRAVFFSFGVVVFFLLLNIYLQIIEAVNLIDTSKIVYKCIYGTIVILLFIVLTGVDYLSKNYNKIKFISEFFNEKDETRS